MAEAVRVIWGDLKILADRFNALTPEIGRGVLMNRFSPDKKLAALGGQGF